MRVVEIVGSLGLGGAERVASEVAVGMVHHGIGGEILCLGPGVAEPQGYELGLQREVESQGVPVTRIAMRGFSDKAGRSALIRYLRDTSPDLVHVHNRPQDWQVVAVARWLGIPAIYTVHLPYEAGGLRARAIRAASAAAVPVIVCVSRAVADQVARTDFAARRKLRVIYNGVRTAVFKPATRESRERLREALGWRTDEFVFLCAARLSEQKGHQFLLDAMARLPSGSRARLVLAGDGPLRSFLEARADRLGVMGRVQFLGTRDDVPALLGAADAFATGTRQEGHPLALLEAMAVGLPVVAPRLPSIEEIALPGAPIFFGAAVPGWAQEHDPDAIARVLADVERDAPSHRAAAAAVHVQVREQFSLQAMVRAHADLYRELVATPPPPQPHS